MAKTTAPKAPSNTGKTKQSGSSQQSPKLTAQEKAKPAAIRQVLATAGGVLKLAPTWVPRRS